MKVTTQYNRRSFLKVSAAASGGLVLGFSWLASCNPTEAQKKNPPKEWFDINAFIRIGDNGLVEIMSPNPEIGQNVKTSMPMIVAEELDVKWEDVQVKQAALNTNWFDRQVAGGSRSIPHGWDSLRMVGAAAKQMLVAAAAAQWEVDASELSVSDGVITNKSGEKLTYGEVANAASSQPTPMEVTLKGRKDYKIIGTGRGNVDIDNIITGKPLFGIDTKVEGMKYATVARPPFYANKVASLDDSEAKKVNGVIDVFKFTVKRMEGFDLEKVAVVANSTWAAIKGQKALKIEWESNSTPGSTAEHDEQLVALLDSPSENTRRADGDIKTAFAEADDIFEKTYESPYLPHNCMEPMNFFAHVTDDKVDSTGPIQTPAWTRNRIIELMGWQEDENAAEKVHIGMTRMGGGFGRRLYGDFSLEAVAVSKQTGNPIQLVWTRENDMNAGTYRPAIKYRIKAAIKDNKITAYQLKEAATNANMYGVLPNNFPAGAIANYQVDNYQLKNNITVGAWRAPYTNFLASAEQSFFDEIAEKMGKDPVDLRLEIFADAKKVYDQHLAIEDKFKDEKESLRYKMEMQGVLVRTKGISDEEKQAHEAKLGELGEEMKASDGKIAEAAKDLPPKGNYEPDRFMEVIKLAAEKSGWKNPKEGEHLGFSVYYSHHTYVAEVAHVFIEEGQPVIKKVTTAVDCGIVVNPLAAENLIQGGVVDGIGHSMYSDFQFENGMPTASNFDKFRLIRMSEAPTVEVHFVDNGKRPTGLGEPTFPPAGGAAANALYRATKERLYKQPYAASKKIVG